MNITVGISRSQVTASTLTSTLIATIGGVPYYAYRDLTNVGLSGSRRWGRWGLGREDYRIDSTAAPLTFVNVSPIRANENLQRYSGPLRVSWSRTLLGAIGMGGGQYTDPQATVNLRHRTDGTDGRTNPGLDCYSAADPEDTNPGIPLICVEVELQLVAQGRPYKAVLQAKSASPFRLASGPQANTASYVVRAGTLTVDPLLLFGRP